MTHNEKQESYNVIESMTMTEAKEVLKEHGLMVEDTDVLSRYESKFTVGTGRFASDKVIQWSQAQSGAIEKNALFYPKHIVDKLIETYQKDIEDLKDQIKELEHELNSMDLER